MKADPGKIDTDGEDAFAWALSSEVSSSTFTPFRVHEPEREIFGHLRGGIYRQELAALLLLSEDFRSRSKLAAELPKADGFGELAKKHKADAMKISRRRRS